MFKQRHKMKYLYFCVFSVLYLVMAIFITRFAENIFSDFHRISAQDDVNNQLALVRSNLEADIFRDIYLADSLSTVVTLAPGFALRNWEEIAQKVMNKSHNIRNFALAPDNIISKVYPFKDNEKALGLDYSTLPEQLATVELAKTTKSMILTSPLKLVQGGQGLIARFPIFSDYPFNQQYWGVISVVIDYDKLITSSGLLAIHGADIALLTDGVTGQPNRVIFGSTETALEANTSFTIHLPDGKWQLFAKFHPNLAEQSSLTHLVYIMGAIAFLVGYLLLLLLFRSYLRLQQLSIQDELTGIANRRFMFQQFNKLAQKSKSDFEITILSIDFDGFKSINDTYGHEAGDAFLKHVAHQLCECTRASDVVARFGGDEFVILLYRVSSVDHIENILKTIRHTLSSDPLKWKGTPIIPSLSIGYAAHKGKVDKSVIPELLVLADKRMYKNKSREKKVSVHRRIQEE